MGDPQRSNFEAAMQALAARQADELAYSRSTWLPASHAASNGGPRLPEDIDAELSRLVDLRCDAEDELIATPAPTLPAVIWKIEYARKRWEEMSAWPDEWWEAVMSDLHRVAATERY